MNELLRFINVKHFNSQYLTLLIFSAEFNMMTGTLIPGNETERVDHLSEFDVDYAGFKETFKDLAKLAAHIAGTEVSLVNLVDSYTQWSISGYGLDLEQMPREDSVCQYTIQSDDAFEVPDLSADSRFSEKFYVADDPSLRYYFGVPLQTDDGYNIGALCVLDKQHKTLTPEKIEMLKIIADEIVTRLTAEKVIAEQREGLLKEKQRQRRIAHDMRSPLSGMIGLARLISEKGEKNKPAEVLAFVDLIHKSGKSLIDLTKEIINTGELNTAGPAEFTLEQLKNKLLTLFKPQAKHKDVSFSVSISAETSSIPFPKYKLLQIIGNLISNAIKCTPIGGSVVVTLTLDIEAKPHLLEISVTDTGFGIDAATQQAILSGKSELADGTAGGHGFGSGLAMVKSLVDKLQGNIEIASQEGAGTHFKVVLPQAGLISEED